MSADVMHVTARDGRTIRARTAGPLDGVPVVLLHGQIHTASCWASVMTGPLSVTHRLIAPDLAGHGGSDRPASGDRDWMARDLADVIAVTKIEAPVLVGWSFGSVVASAYVATGGAARGLVLVGAGTRGLGLQDLDLAGLRALLATSAEGGEASRPLVIDLFHEMLSTEASVADAGVARMIDACRHRALDPATRAVLIRDARAIGADMRAAMLTMPYDNTEFFASCDLPILQIHGARDAIRPVAAAHERGSWFRRGQTEIWADAGHAPFDDEPERFATRIAAFCQETRT